MREAAKRIRVGQAMGSLVSSSCVAMATCMKDRKRRDEK